MKQKQNLKTEREESSKWKQESPVGQRIISAGCSHAEEQTWSEHWDAAELTHGEMEGGREDWRENRGMEIETTDCDRMEVAEMKSGERDVGDNTIVGCQHARQGGREGRSVELTYSTNWMDKQTNDDLNKEA